MKVSFISNYFNHHQSPFSDAIVNKVDDYAFISTAEMDEERKALGWEIKELPGYCHSFQAERKSCDKRINSDDIVIYGSAQNTIAIRRNLKGKVTFRYAERQFKNVKKKYKYLYWFLKWHFLYPKCARIFLLSASAYASADFAKLGVFKNKAYKWGYFPECKRYENLEKLIGQKQINTILWCGRLIPLKHPEMIIALGKQLKDCNIEFHIKIVGVGEMKPQLMSLAEENHLVGNIEFLGVMSPAEVRLEMEKSGIFIFTSDKNEGWGVVLNEAMNSGCAVIASHVIGSVPYLIKDGINGMVFESENAEELYQKTKKLIQSPELQQEIGRNAYHTIADEWNAETAATRLCELSKHILSGEKAPDLYSSGPCSRAEIIEDDWYGK